jgi:hypothetical protein
MPEPITVWMVHLGRGRDPQEVKGVLALHADTLVFTHAREGGTTRFPLAQVRRARRNRGTPILMVEWVDREVKRSTAFYFVKPPPLHPEERGGLDDPAGPSQRPGLGALRKSTKRRQYKQNVTYLTSSGGTMKQMVQAWADELRPLLGNQGD